MPAPPDRYQTHTLTLELAGRQVRLTQLTNFDELLEELIAKGEEHEDVRDERIPYWADLWHSAIALGRYLVREQVVRAGEPVTEIGCGLGLPGIVAGLLGGEVTLSDYLPEALELARHNWALNLDRPVTTITADWRQPEQFPPATLLLASDVAYEARAFPALLQAFPLLCPPGGRILLTEPNRPMAQDFLAELAADARYSCTRSVEKVFWNEFWKEVNVLDLRVEGI